MPEDTSRRLLSEADLPFRQLAQSLSLPCWISDEVGQIVWVNDAWLTYTGWNVEQIQREGLKPLHDPDTYGDVVRKWTAVMAAGAADEMVFPLRGRDGGLKPFHTRVVPLREADGRLSGWFGTNTDVSAQVEAEVRLRSSEERWREVFERAGDAIFVADRDGLLITVNPAALAMSGYETGELIGRSVFELIIPEERPDLVIARANDESVRDWRLRRKDGSILHVEISSRRLSDGRRLGVARDVSTRRLAEQSLTQEAAEQRSRAIEAERQLARFWDASRDLFAIVSTTDGLPKLINARAWRDTLGYEEPELLETRLFDLVHPDDVERTWAQRRNNLDIDYFGFENRYLAKDGREVWLSWNVVRDGELTYCSARDITFERHARDELQRADERLAHNQKMETIGQLTGGVAHDFNNLLMIMAGHSELLRGRIGDDSRALGSLEAIATAAQRGQELTRRLLAFSRRQRLNPVALSLCDHVAHLEPLLVSSLGGGISLEVDCPAEIWPIIADAGELQAALLNMAVNARDAMPQGGRFRLVASNVHPPAGQGSRVGAAEGEAAADFVDLTVSDTGYGIPPDILDKIVEPYFTTKDLNRGNGLGLSQVYGFVEQSGGRMRIESELGRGTSIHLSLPRASEAPADKSPPQETSATPSLRILLVEDNAEVAEISARLLEALGHRLSLASSAQTGLRLAEDGGFDLVISDIVMAGEFNGLALARRLRQTHPDLPILLVTGYSREAEAIGDEFPVLAKPFHLRELDLAIEIAVRPQTTDA